MKKYILLLLLVSMASCKSKAILAEGKAGTDANASSIIQMHYANLPDFKSIYIKADARYEDDENTQNVSAEIKIEKDKQILVSIRFLGITMAKALITPKQVKYYEKIGGKYFEGDYTTLSRWLGADLDYSKVQNLLVGRAMDDLSRSKYTSTIEDKLHKLSATEGGNAKSFYFESTKALIKKQEIVQAAQKRNLTVEYPNYAQHGVAFLPTAVLIEALHPKGKTNITVDYNSATFNEELSFPYSVPEGYERIFID
jgi:hypothetical protein